MEKAEREAATQRVRPKVSGKNAFSREATDRMVGNASGQRTENFLRLILHVKKMVRVDSAGKYPSLPAQSYCHFRRFLVGADQRAENFFGRTAIF